MKQARILEKKTIRSIAKLAYLLAIPVLLLIFVSSSGVNASHSWGNYHWARKNNPFLLKLNSNLTLSWQPYLSTTSTDWSFSNILDTSVMPGYKNPKTCKPTNGQIEVCNASYGSNGWLGLAQIWISGSHITQGVVKMNDTYMTRFPYDTVAEKNHVMCQEVGHVLGLGHQDESGADWGTCMDYSMSDNSQHPNAHDYYMLEQIYSHLDSSSTISSLTGSAAAKDDADMNNKQNWGRRVFRSKSGTLEIYERSLKDGSKILTSVTLAL